MRKIFIPVFTLALSTACLAQSKKKAPNVLFILVDDMQSTCIHAYGCDQVHSPNIDRIVDNGISFTRTYTNGSLGGALSMPSRAMIMTGRGVYQVIQDGARIPEQHVTLPELLRQNGYTTFATGNGIRIVSLSTALSRREKIFSSEECILIRQTDMYLHASIITTRQATMQANHLPEKNSPPRCLPMRR